MKNRRTRKGSLLSLLLAVLLLSGGISLSADENQRYFSGEAQVYCEDLMAQGFPKDYAFALTELHLLHPNWEFVPLMITEMQPKYTWNYVISEENRDPDTNLIYSSQFYAAYHHPSNPTIYDSSYRQVSDAALAYFMDPRNFLNETDIFQFYDLSLQNEGSLSSVEAVLANTFMEDALLENGMTFAAYFAEVGNALGINPVYLAVKARQEQGVNGTSPIISGTCGTLLEEYYSEQKQSTASGTHIRPPAEGHTSEELLALNGYYNMFNVGASGNGLFPIYYNAMQRAITGTEEMKDAWGGSSSWDTLWKSIYGGAYFMESRYIGDYKNTIYLNKFNVDCRANGNFYLQYMQNVGGAMSEARTLYASFSHSGVLDSPCTFLIPVYGEMPPSPSPDPAHGTCESFAIASNTYSYAVSLFSPASKTIQNAPHYASCTRTTVEELRISGKVTHDYGVKGLEYRWNTGEWLPLSAENGFFEISFDMSFPEDTQHILTIRATADYDHEDRNKKANTYFLCCVLYVNVVAPPQANVSYVSRDWSAVSTLPIGGGFRLLPCEDRGFLAWCGSDGTVLPSGYETVLQGPITYTALFLSDFEQLTGAALLQKEDGPALRFYAAVAKSDFEALSPFFERLSFHATVSCMEERYPVAVETDKTVFAFEKEWQLLHADTAVIAPGAFDEIFSIDFSLSSSDPQKAPIPPRAPNVSGTPRTVREIARAALDDSTAGYSEELIVWLTELANAPIS